MSYELADKDLEVSANELFGRLAGNILKCCKSELVADPTLEEEFSFDVVYQKGAPGGRSIGDFDRYGKVFNNRYFFKNLFKCCVVAKYIEKMGLLSPGRVVDIGCGAGVFSIAWLSVFRYSTSTMIDCSKRQIKLAKKIVGALAIDADVKFGEFPNQYIECLGLRLISYWFCEYFNVDSLRNKYAIAEIVGEEAVVIDFEDNIHLIIDKISNQYSVQPFKLVVPINDIYLDLIGDIFVNIAACYVRVL